MFHFHVREAGNCKAVVQGEAVYSGIRGQSVASNRCGDLYGGCILVHR
ncbi:hypothetical protein ALP78_200010 [Pseudomonas coronafaciens pv. striafaciens]|uniref:Uncharacterized protein n=1 Tax=Pseudomonas coronafaciens pv. striafaciens TaxID=235276 RepID=A0A3M4XTX3_9PSED|nr:hypothetical protein ALP78_200010 [Pseudomonas coronafaciens pv. striafaciens]